MTLVNVATGPAGSFYRLLVLLHVVCAVGGFGALVYGGLVLELARRRGEAAAAGVLAVYGQISQLGEILVYGVLLFGIGAVVASGHRRSFSQAWVAAGLAVLVVMVGVLHGLVRPAERRYRHAMLELAQLPVATPPARPAGMAELQAQLDGLRRRVSAGWGAFNVLLLGALYLMVFKP